MVAHPISATKRTQLPIRVIEFFLFCCGVALYSMTSEVMSPMSRSDQRANNLQPKLKQLSVVLVTVDTAEQEVGRGE